VYLDPGKLPAEFGDVEVRNLPLAGRREVDAPPVGKVPHLAGEAVPEQHLVVAEFQLLLGGK
jgi:hypothetical protein